MRLSYQITVAINCWHRIDTAWKGLTGTEVHGNYDVCLDLFTWSSQSMPLLFGSRLQPIIF